MDYHNLYDMIIIGGGPAGLSSAIYMARAKYKTLVIEKEKFGGQITITSEIVNYPGVYKTSGKQLTADMQKQAASFGAEFKLTEVISMDLSQDIKVIKTTSGEYRALGVILAVGASPRQIGFSGEEEFKGRGVAYCATCDGEFFTGKPVYVVGGGFAAVEEAIFLTKFATSVHIIVREDDFTCAKTVAEKVYEESKITVSFNSEVQEITGDNHLKTIQIIDNSTNNVKTVEHPDGFGVFVFAGYLPNTKWLKDQVALENGYIVTDRNQRTNIPGVYAAGDVCIKDLRQVVTAVSDGATAATDAEKVIAKLHKSLDIPFFEMNTSKEEEHQEINEVASDAFIDQDMIQQLKQVFGKFENEVTIKGVLNDSDLALEMSSLLDEFSTISPMVKVEKERTNEAPYLEILDSNKQTSGICFYAMPGGHEFNSFILSLYNVAGPGQQVAQEDHSRVNDINKSVDLKVLISLSCTMCPEVVVASGKLASMNSNIKASTYDISKSTELKDKYNVMSVPCLVINDEIVHFGKKNISQILDIIVNL